MPSSDPPVATTPAKTAGLLLVARRWAEAHGLPWSSVDQIALLVDLRGVAPAEAQRSSATTTSRHHKNVVDAEQMPFELSCQKQRETGASAVREGNL